MKKLTLIFLVCLLFSCSKQENKKLANIESIMLTHPDSALALLQKDSASIHKEGKDAQMYYQIIRCRVADLLYIPHTSDSVMLKVSNYYAKQNNLKALSMAYYCLACIYRDLSNHPLAINYFHKAIDTDSINTPKELIARSYYQLAGLEENRNNNAQAVIYNILAYKNIIATQDYHLANCCLIDIAHNYYFLNKEKEYSYYIRKARQEIIKQNDSENLSRLIITEGQEAVLDKNSKKLRELIIEGKNKLHHLGQQKIGFCLMQGYYYKYMNMPDSATYYFKMVIAERNTIGKYAAYNALAEIKTEKKDYAAALAYLKQAKALRDIVDSIDDKQEAEKMKAAYNYEMETDKREEAEEKSNNYQYAILLCIIGILVLSTLILILKNSAKKKSIKQLMLITQQYERIKNQECKIEEQDRNILKLENRNNELSKYQLLSTEVCNNKFAKKLKVDDDKWNQFRMSAAYINLHKMTRNGLTEYTASELHQAIEDIIVTIDSIFNDYGKRLMAALPGLKDSQLKFAYLVKAELRSAKIATLLSKSKSSISKIKKSFESYFEGYQEDIDVFTFLREF